eukprot:COSAG01_NODE_3124_length_6550_cov_213.272981_4_plen_49_part_00
MTSCVFLDEQKRRPPLKFVSNKQRLQRENMVEWIIAWEEGEGEHDAWG